MIYTKEPLRLAGGGLIYRLSAPEGGHNVDEINVTMWAGSRVPDDRAEGAQRVMACIDACAGISNDDLKMFAELGATQMQSYDEVKTQRDELLAALEQFIDQEGNPPEDTGEWREVLRVIASVKGEKCKTCNGAGGHEVAASSTSYFWKECDGCDGNGMKGGAL